MTSTLQDTKVTNRFWVARDFAYEHDPDDIKPILHKIMVELKARAKEVAGLSDTKQLTLTAVFAANTAADALSTAARVFDEVLASVGIEPVPLCWELHELAPDIEPTAVPLPA